MIVKDWLGRFNVRLEKCSTWPGNQSLGKTEEMSRPREQIQADGWYHSWSEPSWTGDRHLMTSLSTSKHIRSMSPHIYHNAPYLSPERSHWHGRWHTGRVFLGNARDGSPNIWREEVINYILVTTLAIFTLFRIWILHFNDHLVDFYLSIPYANQASVNKSVRWFTSSMLMFLPLPVY